MRIPVQYFPVVDGSMTSEDGQQFLLHVRCEDGSELLLGFPHAELPSLVECAAMQMDKGRGKDGDRLVTAFSTSGFQVGRGANAEIVLSLTISGTGKISFLLPHGMAGELEAALVRAGTRH
jgi:hypothetical protein